jgi:preprotein translocase subunit SecG
MSRLARRRGFVQERRGHATGPPSVACGVGGSYSATASVFAHACATPALHVRKRYAFGVETVDSIIQVALCVAVIFLVLMHSGKDSGLSGAFGVGSGTGPLGGGSLVERNLNRWTIFFAVLFFVNAIVLLKRPWA